MDTTLLGVPLIFWGAICLFFAITWALIWPSHKGATLHGLRYFIMRWFHALVWLLLALAAFIAAFTGPSGALVAPSLAFLSLIAYLIFMVTLAKS